MIYSSASSRSRKRLGEEDVHLLVTWADVNQGGEQLLGLPAAEGFHLSNFLIVCQIVGGQQAVLRKVWGYSIGN